MGKNKQQVPRLRFPGFNDAWEQRKLGEVASVSMCKRIYKNQTLIEGDIPFYKIGTFGKKADAFIAVSNYVKNHTATYLSYHNKYKLLVIKSI